jgi:hypothetical protein
MSPENNLLREAFEAFMKDWISLKKEAIAKKDFGLYIWYLKEIHKVFSESYVKNEGRPVQELLGNILKTASCEIKGNMLKYNKTMDELVDLKNEDLLSLWQKGRDWLNTHDQHSLDETYNPELYLKCLKRIEAIEDELRKRGVKYG